jgi:hypothetical protein
LNRIKKKGPSYSQLQKKKKKKQKKKLDKKKQTFYEKVLSKTIGQPLIQSHDGSKQDMEYHYFVDPMNKTQNLKNISAHAPESGYSRDHRLPNSSEIANSRNIHSLDGYSGYNAGGINIS